MVVPSFGAQCSMTFFLIKYCQVKHSSHTCRMHKTMLDRRVKLVIAFLCIALTGQRGVESELCDENPTVTLKQGQAKGKYLKSTNGKIFSAFLGIPYGKVEKRFASPDPADSWSGIFDATKDGPPCKQYDILFFKHRIFGQEKGCLVLNVYTPRISEDNLTTSIPVMIFIHGGGFMFGQGSSSAYGPELYMNKDIVLVLMNYRVGPIGFLSTGDEELPGNYGLLDQVVALRWVKDNIHSFGGDPNSVTLSGESAGAVSVVFHLISPLSKGLFHKAIAQSGSALCPWTIQNDPLNVTQTIAQKVECPTENTTIMIKCLSEVDADLLVKAAYFEEIKGFSKLSTMPVIENPVNGKFLTESPLKLLKEGKINKVPVISGIASNESITFASAFLNPQSPFETSNFTEDDWEKFIKAIVAFGMISEKLNDSELLKSIKQKYYENVSSENKSKDFLWGTLQLMDDTNFKICNDKTVELLVAAGVPVYTYVWDYADQMSPLTIEGKPLAFHGIDLFYLFNVTNLGLFNYSIDDVKEFSDQVLELWSNFAKEGNPTPASKPVKWIPTQAKNKKYLNITSDMKMEDGSITEAFKFWEKILYT